MRVFCFKVNSLLSQRQRAVQILGLPVIHCPQVNATIISSFKFFKANLVHLETVGLTMLETEILCLTIAQDLHG